MTVGRYTPLMEPELYAVLDQRLRGLEGEAARLRADLDAALGVRPRIAPPVAPAATAAPVRAASTPPPSSLPAPKPGFSLEVFFAGRGLQVVGLVLVLVGAAFFLNLAFTRGWIGPAERIVLGLVAGVVLIGVGARGLRSRGTPVCEGLIGLGGGILYLSLWAAVAVFPQLHVGRSAAFVAMVAVTATLTVLAAVRRSERVALLGLVGGFLTPLLLSSDTPQRAILAAYVLVLGVAFSALAVRARFRFVEATVFIASVLYLPVFAVTGDGWRAAPAYGVATAIFALYAVAFTVSALRERDGSNAMVLRVVLLTVDALVYAAMLGVIFADDLTRLGVTLLALAAAMLIAARFVTGARSMTRTFAYLALSAVTLALPALLHQDAYALLDAFALEGAILTVLGARGTDAVVEVAGFVMIGIVALWLLLLMASAQPAGSPLNSLALSTAITVAAAAVARREARATASVAANATGWNVAGTVIANGLALAGLSRFVLDALGGPSWNVAISSQVHVVMSLVWTTYAATLFGLGLSRGSALLQRLGLILLGVTILKVFTVDTSTVDVAWRIVSFVVLGLVCMGVSAWYLRSRGRSAKEPAA